MTAVEMTLSYEWEERRLPISTDPTELMSVSPKMLRKMFSPEAWPPGLLNPMIGKAGCP